MTANGGRLVDSIFQPTPQLIVGALGLATAIALLGAVVPSRRAARLEALEALLYE